MEALNDKDDIIGSFPKPFVLASKFPFAISEKLKQNFKQNILTLENEKSDERDYRFGEKMGRGTGKVHDIVDPNLNCLEKTWINTEFSIKNDQVQIKGDINNIDREIYPNLYADLAGIFQEILPKINQVKSLKNFEKLNLAIRVQSYEVKKDEYYEGNFHQEGYKSEGIILVALYYFHVSPNIKGGELELKFVKEKQDKGFNFENKLIPVKEGDLLVFRNFRCEHKVNRLEAQFAKEGQIYERKVIAFFICDPNKSIIPTTKAFKVNAKLSEKEKTNSYALRDQFRASRVLIEELDYLSNGEEELEEENKKNVENTENPNPINISVKSVSGEIIKVDVFPNFSVELLKTMILEDVLNVPYEDQRLIFEGNALENDKLLTDYKISNNSVIHFVKKVSSKALGGYNDEITVYIETLLKKIYTIKIYKNDTVEKLKELVMFQTGIPVDQMRLIVGNVQLVDNRTLLDYNIKNEDKIILILRLVGD